MTGSLDEKGNSISFDERMIRAMKVHAECALRDKLDTHDSLKRSGEQLAVATSYLIAMIGLALNGLGNLFELSTYAYAALIVELMLLLACLVFCIIVVVGRYTVNTRIPTKDYAAKVEEQHQAYADNENAFSIDYINDCQSIFESYSIVCEKKRNWLFAAYIVFIATIAIAAIMLFSSIVVYDRRDALMKDGGTNYTVIDCEGETPQKPTPIQQISNPKPNNNVVPMKEDKTFPKEKK